MMASGITVTLQVAMGEGELTLPSLGKVHDHNFHALNLVSVNMT